ncbi:MAG: substrate-binding domain-containing protein, partial [Clostridiales bacterium]|nr:substrate-binding domain-containing protein [Clostridiales bacterium]
TTWDELGVEGLGEIIAYQRPENSGSQTALEKLMGDTPIMEAPQMYVSDGMEDILETIEYRNLPNAIGYTFRFFCADMVGSKVKLLAIDGIEPTVENISNGKYPIITPLYAVTRKGESNPNVKRLLDFLTDPQGQELVEKSGYVGLVN